MKIIVVLCFLVAIWSVLKKSRKFARYLKAYETNPTLLSEKKVYEYMVGYFQELAKEVYFWLVIACICVIALAWII